MKPVLITALLCFSAAVLAWDKPVSGYAYLPEQMQRMQDDEFENPGMETVEEGGTRFRTPGYNGKSCASCHGEGGGRLDPKAIARYPVYSTVHRGPLTLQQRIAYCREQRLDEFPLPYDDPELIALETYVRHLARGEKVNVDVNGPLRPWYESGKALYHTRIGQLDMSCQHCHDRYVDLKLRDQVLNQGHSNAFPAYRLQSGAISSLHGKFRDCYATLRALPYAVGSDEFIALEVYLNARGNGLAIETPGIRR
jgi:sulfur-oxidizing protein SoxA